MLIDVRRSPLLPALLSVGYIVTPVRDWGWLEGRPLDLLSTAALAAVCWLWLGPHRDRLARTGYTIATYAAGATLMVPALHWIGAMITPQRALLQREMAMVGAIGVAAYAAIWIDAAWPSGRSTSARACQGLALGMFVTILFGTVIGHAGVAPTIAAGLLMGVIQAERGAAQPVRSQ